MNIISMHNNGIQASKKAVKKFLEDWNKNTGGNQYGEPMYCGFAGVVIYDVRSNSKIGKQLQEIGFRKHYPKGLYLNNPSNHHGQSMDCKEEGASAYAKIFRDAGLKAYMTSRPD
tara:strand:- start:329 stop:673 length:345 start_codon:yes stop_codon:yes gene_type:complete